MHRSESHKINAIDVIDVAAILAFCRAEPSLTVQGSGAGFVRGISFDSRDIREGFIFVAVQGTHRDGRDFLGLALRAGAQVILTDLRPLDAPDGVLLLQVNEPRQLAARLATWFYAPHPAGQVLVTGTNGKTSVADYTRQLWQILGYPAASIGTLGLIAGDETAKGSLTSPDAATLAQNLQHIQRLGIERVCIEASSHSLDQYRLEGTVPRIGVFSGLGHDHLDYHESPESYLAAKLGLFERLLPSDGVALFAVGRSGSDAVAALCDERGIVRRSFGIECGDIQACNLERHGGGIGFELHDQDLHRHVRLNLVGDFQCLNVLAAYGVLVAMGEQAGRVAEALDDVRSVPGRMQRVGVTPKGAVVYVDYAHTPDALEAVLVDIRPYFEGRLRLGFGCGGNRDSSKRMVMGQVAQGADDVIVTDDNPRNEDPELIRREVLRGIPHAREIGDRGTAIAVLCTEAEAGDLVLIAGKGHERGQIVGDRVLAFDDVSVARGYCVEGMS